MPDLTTSRSQKLFEDLKEFFKAMYRYMGCFGELIRNSYKNTRGSFLALKAKIVKILSVRKWIIWISNKIKQFLIGTITFTQIAITRIIDEVVLCVLSLIFVVFKSAEVVRHPISAWKMWAREEKDTKGDPEISWVQKLLDWFSTKNLSLKDEVTPHKAEFCLTMDDVPPGHIDDMPYAFNQDGDFKLQSPPRASHDEDLPASAEADEQYGRNYYNAKLTNGPPGQKYFHDFQAGPLPQKRRKSG